ncbi:MAG: PilZ domain-containing protein [Deltaproteobacteria bacterium]
MKLKERIKCLFCLVSIYILCNPAAVGAVDWNQFQGTVNKGFSKENIYDSNKIYAFMIAIIAVIVIVALFQWWNAQLRKEQQAAFKQYKQKQKEIESKASNPAHKRKWFRLATRAQLRWIQSDQADHVRENKYFVDQLVDISAEGMCFSTAQELLPGTHLSFLLDIGDNRVLSITGEALRIFDSNEEFYDSEGQKIEKHNVAIKFSYMSPGDNDRLVSWITRRQRDSIHETQEQDKPKEDNW